ncbi:hypothetical protein Rhal01_03258 [Rubritalea halochordaticola]|uniref:Transposase DDE domain-containing protein n=1 Tax=Rubritalea halochordaticola TaxID=714537 RepID=A0ABP9V388_9BACT
MSTQGVEVSPPCKSIVWILTLAGTDDHTPQIRTQQDVSHIDRTCYTHAVLDQFEGSRGITSARTTVVAILGIDTDIIGVHRGTTLASGHAGCRGILVVGKIGILISPSACYRRTLGKPGCPPIKVDSSQELSVILKNTAGDSSRIFIDCTNIRPLIHGC